MKNDDRPRRETRQRRLVYETVMKRWDHPSAEEIYKDVRKEDERISKATVYRNLKLLSESGEILHVRVAGADRYDRTLGDHVHLHCVLCGLVEDAPEGCDTAQNAFVEEKTGMRILSYRAVYEGICRACRSKTEPKKTSDRGRSR